MDCCETCRFYAALKRQCRKHPPVPMLVGANAEGPVVLGAYPPVDPTDKCGEWEEHQ